jgi:superfamily II DNA or RNA helicase
MKELRPYQREACDAIMSDWQSHRSTLLVLATGCGKTFTASEIIARRQHAGRVLWLAHREELITQARDAIVAHTALRVGIEKAEQRAEIIGGLWGDTDDVVVASVQTLASEKRRGRFSPGMFGTVIVDEAHHATSKTYRDILNHFPYAQVLGLTATPDRGDGVAMGEVFDSVAHEYQMRAAIDDGFLAPIVQQRLECADLDLSTARTTAGDINQGDLDKAMRLDAVLHQVAGPLVREAGERSTIVFTVSVDQAHALADVLRGYTSAGIRAIDGTTPTDLRRKYLAEFAAGEVQYMLNCGVLTEGFDAPRTACIAVARPTKSRALYTQMVGRGARTLPGVIDRFDTVQARVAAIAASAKQNCLVLDFVGNSGRHLLITTKDILAGKALPPDVAKRVSDLEAKGMPTHEALAKAEAEAIAREEKAAAAAARKARAKAETAYRKTVVDPFGCIDEADRHGSPASSGQIDCLRSFGAQIDESNLPTSRQASKMIDKLVDRRRRGLATYKQAKLLRKHDLTTDIPIREASQVIDALAANGWRVTPQLRAKYGAQASREASAA